jgi:hypothetical protein
MSNNIASSVGNSISFSMSEVNGDETLTLTDSASEFRTYLYGIGTDKITNIVSYTGVLPSGGTNQIDLFSLPQTTFKYTQNIEFTGVKYFAIFNTDSDYGYDFNITATGINACTNLFNGGSGNLVVKPDSSFSYNDKYDGFAVSSNQRYVYLNDAGSGVHYKLFVLGLDS